MWLFLYNDYMKKKSLLKDILDVIISVCVITFLLLKFVVFPCEVDGLSMYPTLNEDDICYSFIFTKNIGIDRFDIVVIDTSEKLIVKRVIGLPNDCIEYKNNQLYVNGELTNEKYLVDVVTENLSITVPDGEYFCLGDNRTVSRDSRYYGTFRFDQIRSSHILVLYPFKNMGFNK